MEDDDDIKFGQGIPSGVSNRRRTPGVTQNQRQSLAQGLGVTVNANQRNQAGAGSLGTTLGDSSGTGANTQPQNRGFLTIGQNSGPSLDNSPSAQANETIRRLGRLQRSNRLSPGRALRLQNEAIGDLLSAETTRRGQDINQGESVADRNARLSTSDADRQSNVFTALSRIASQENISGNELGVRQQEGQADRGLRRELGQLDLTSRALDRQQQAAQAQAQLEQGDRRLDLSEADSRNTQQFRESQLGLDRQRLNENQRQFNAQERRLLENAGIDASSSTAGQYLSFIQALSTSSIPENQQRAFLGLLGLGPEE